MDHPDTDQMCLDIREQIVERIGPGRYRTWFSDLTEFRLKDGRLDVLVPSAFVGDWIAQNFRDDLLAAARVVLGRDQPLDVRVLKRADAPPGAALARTPGAALERTPGAAPREPERRPPRPPDGRALRGELTTFVVGASNRLAYEAACQTVRAPGDGFRLLVLHGGCGRGKTHLLHGLCNGVRRAHPMLEWRYISGEEFTNEYIYAVRSGRIDVFRARTRKVDVLVIDDIHFLANKKATQEEFLHTFDAVDAAGKAVVLTSDRHPREIATLAEPLISRLVAGMVVEIGAPDMDTRREIVRRRAAAIGCDAPAEVLELIARKITRNVRELEGALFKLKAYASLSRGPLTVEMAHVALEDHIDRPRTTPTVAEIVGIVAARFRVTRQQIEGKSRDRTVSLARAVTMLLVRRSTTMSFPEIGRALGGKNHSTVLMATQRIERQLRADRAALWKTADGAQQAPLRQLVEELTTSINANLNP